MSFQAVAVVKPDYDKNDDETADTVPIFATVWMGQKENDIRKSIQQVLEGHLRGVISELTVVLPKRHHQVQYFWCFLERGAHNLIMCVLQEEVWKDKSSLAKLVAQNVEPDLAKLGFKFVDRAQPSQLSEVLCRSCERCPVSQLDLLNETPVAAENGFKISAVGDDVGYMEALGVERDAKAKADARVQVARKECESAVRVKESEVEESIKSCVEHCRKCIDTASCPDDAVCCTGSQDKGRNQ